MAQRQSHKAPVTQDVDVVDWSDVGTALGALLLHCGSTSDKHLTHGQSRHSTPLPLRRAEHSWCSTCRPSNLLDCLHQQVRSSRPSPTLSPTDPVPRGLLTLCPGASSGPQGLYTAYIDMAFAMYGLNAAHSRHARLRGNTASPVLQGAEGGSTG